MPNLYDNPFHDLNREFPCLFYMEKELTVYDNTEYYKKEIEPLINEIKHKCNRKAMPFFIATCIANNEKESVYANDMLASVSNNIILKDDLIPKFINVYNGFDTVLNKCSFEIDMDDLRE